MNFNKQITIIGLSKDFIPASFNGDIVLAPSSVRAGGLDDIYISALGTKIPGASISYNKEDINKEPPNIENNIIKEYSVE